MNIVTADEVYSQLVHAFQQQSLIPVLGSGFSCGGKAFGGRVPDGKAYRKHMTEAILAGGQEYSREKLATCSFSDLCQVYEDDEAVKESVRRAFYRDNFSRAELDGAKKAFLDLNWPYIYTLNIDDAIERNSPYKCVILPGNEVSKEIFRDERCVIKLHGDIEHLLKYPKGMKVFTSKEYSMSLYSNGALLEKLRHDFTHSNILIVGCSLDSEADLLTADILRNEKKEELNYSRVYYCTVTRPDGFTVSKLKAYGVTDVILFQSYAELYEKIAAAGRESQRISTDDIEKFHNFPVRRLDRYDGLNAQMFYYGFSPVNTAEHVISLPYYFIERDLAGEILKNIGENKLHLIFGRSISGKSFLLYALGNGIHDRSVYFFNSTTELNDPALDKLLKKENSVIIFDTGVLTEKQFERVLLSTKELKANRSNVVVALSRSDVDLLGIMEWKTKEGEVAADDFIQYNLSDKLGAAEAKRINGLLPACKFPAMSGKRTILDNLVNAEQLMKKEDAQFTGRNLVIEDKHTLVFLIAIATKGRLTSVDVNTLNLEETLGTVLERYKPFIERDFLYSFEKDGDYASVKFILNAQYWLYHELGSYSSNKKNYDAIVEAYEYIIKRQFEASGGRKEAENRCKQYIMLDTINRIFMQSGGQLFLIERIYKALRPYLSESCHFLHQYAKLCLKMSYVLREREEKLRYIKDGIEFAKVAFSMVTADYEAKGNENLLITQSHIQYTVATLLSGQCVVEGFSDRKRVDETLEQVTAALNSPYNLDKYRSDTDRGSVGISRFLRNLRERHSDLLDRELKHRVEQLLGYLISIR